MTPRTLFAAFCLLAGAVGGTLNGLGAAHAPALALGVVVAAAAALGVSLGAAVIHE